MLTIRQQFLFAVYSQMWITFDTEENLKTCRFLGKFCSSSFCDFYADLWTFIQDMDDDDIFRKCRSLRAYKQSASCLCVQT